MGNDQSHDLAPRKRFEVLGDNARSIQGVHGFPRQYGSRRDLDDIANETMNHILEQEGMLAKRVIAANNEQKLYQHSANLSEEALEYHQGIVTGSNLNSELQAALERQMNRLTTDNLNIIEHNYVGGASDQMEIARRQIAPQRKRGFFG